MATVSAWIVHLVEGQVAAGELDDERDAVLGGEFVTCPGGRDAGVDAAVTAVRHREAAEFRIAGPHTTVAAARRDDQVGVLVVPDGHVGAELADEGDHRLRLGFAGRAGAGVLPVAGLADRAPPQREVPIQVDLIRIVAILRGLAVGIHRVDEPPLDVRREIPGRRPVAQLLDDRDAAVLVAVDHADDQHSAAADGAEPVRNDRAAFDGGPEHDRVSGEVEGRRKGPRRQRAGRGAGGRGAGGRGAGGRVLVVVVVVVVLVVVDDGAVAVGVEPTAVGSPLSLGDERARRRTGPMPRSGPGVPRRRSIDRSMRYRRRRRRATRMVAARPSRRARGFTSS